MQASLSQARAGQMLRADAFCAVSEADLAAAASSTSVDISNLHITRHNEHQ